MRRKIRVNVKFKPPWTIRSHTILEIFKYYYKITACFLNGLIIKTRTGTKVTEALFPFSAETEMCQAVRSASLFFWSLSAFGKACGVVHSRCWEVLL